MLLERIRKHKTLAKYLSDDCEEAGICVAFDDKVADDSYIIIKVDQYYNAEVTNPPPSPDCLIVQRCAKAETYALTIIELKSISSSHNFTVDNMTGKFVTCLNDFMERRFRHFFNRDYVRVDLFFVSRIEKYKRDAGLRMRILTNKKFAFRSKYHIIKQHMPNPAIKPCY